MINVLVIHELLHEAKELEDYIASCYGNPNITLCVNAGNKEIMNVIILKRYFNSRSPMFFAVFTNVLITLTVSTLRKPSTHSFFTKQSFCCILADFELSV